MVKKKNDSIQLNLRQETFSAATALLEAKIASLRNALHELSEGAANEGKSSAGDKHETARAMAQLEQEKLGKQLQDAEQQKMILEKNNGTLLKTNRGYLFVCIALGKLSVDTIPVMAISPQSPLGAKLAGKKAGDSVSMNGTDYLIEEIFS